MANVDGRYDALIARLEAKIARILAEQVRNQRFAAAMQGASITAANLIRQLQSAQGMVQQADLGFAVWNLTTGLRQLLFQISVQAGR